MEFQRIAVCLDMRGCPNRCKHCWIGHSPNGNLGVEDLKYAAEQFRPYTKVLGVDDWYREPDYKDDYREMWELVNAMSDVHEDHFELASIWRLVRDPGYAPWLASLGVKKCQLTLFGGEELTDRYTGRKGAYRDILRSMDILLENGIAPRIQFFLNRETAKELPFLEELIRELDLERRCREIGEEFVFFCHTGGCDGENKQFYDIWATEAEVAQIPEALKNHTVKHFGVTDIMEVFGQTEAELLQRLRREDPRQSLVSDSPVFYIDKDFNVYPNFTAPSEGWCLGNLKTDGVWAVLENYRGNRSIAQQAWQTLPIEELGKLGDPKSRRLFVMEDYLIYLMNRYCDGE